MGFYDLPKKERKKLVEKMKQEIKSDLEGGDNKSIRKYASDQDTYIRKNT